MTRQELIAWRASFKRPRAKSMTGPKPSGLSQKKAAQRLGFSLRQYCAWESGEAPVPRVVEILTSARFRHGKAG